MRITRVIPLKNYRLELTFNDGTRGIADLSNLIGSGVFKLWNDYSEFTKVKIGDTGELTWGEQVDLCPDSLFLKVTGKKPEDVFSALKHASVYA
jgi:hypothetical protein